MDTGSLQIFANPCKSASQLCQKKFFFNVFLIFWVNEYTTNCIFFTFKILIQIDPAYCTGGWGGYALLARWLQQWLMSNILRMTRPTDVTQWIKQDSDYHKSKRNPAIIVPLLKALKQDLELQCCESKFNIISMKQYAV